MTNETNNAPNWLISALIMTMVLAANAVLIVGLLQMLTWVECAMLVVTGALLSGGILLTVTTMHRLSEEK